MKVIVTDEFTEWLNGIKDIEAKATINLKIRTLACGGSVDVKAVREKLFEIRIFKKPGYRVYYSIIDDLIVFYGGIKKSQTRDINKAIKLMKKWEAGNAGRV